MWGAQLETGGYPSSYIPTAGASVTRNSDAASTVSGTRAADRVSMTGTNFSSWFNPSEGTIFMGAYMSPTTATTYPRYFSISDGTYNNQIHIFQSPVPHVGAEVITGGSFVYASGLANPSPAAGSFAKLSIAYKNNSTNGYINGSTQSSVDTNVSIPVVNRLSFDANDSGIATINDHIAFFMYYPKRLPDNTLSAITSI